MPARNPRWLAVAITALLATLACTLNLGGPKPPGDPIAVSTAALTEMAESWQTAFDPLTGEARITITETQLTSLLAQSLAMEEDPPLRDPQVYLRDGRIQIYGTAANNLFRANALVEVSATVGEDGSLNLSVESANFGPLPVPESLLKRLSDAIESTLGLDGNNGLLPIRLTDLKIADGEMLIVGTIG